MKEVNKENEFERLLKEKADRFELKPAPEVWQQVQDAIQKERRRRFAWWLVAALLFGVLGTGAFFMLEKKSSPPAALSTAENNSDRSNNAANNSSSETNDSKKNPASGSVNDNTSTVQNQSADITPPENQREKISKNKSQNESHSAPVYSRVESPEDVQALIPPMAEEPGGNTSVPPEYDKLNSQPNEFIAPLSSKQFTLSLSEDTIHTFPLETPLLDFPSTISLDKSFYIETEAMPLASFVWNHASSPSPKLYTTAFVPQAYNNSYSSIRGYAAGANFFFQKNNKWMFGAGAHLSKTHLEAITAQETDLQYDSVGTANDTSGVMEPVYDTVLVTTTLSQHAINQWLDISLMTGVKLFPDSKNHLRILAGIGYSRLLSSEISMIQNPGTSLDGTIYTGVAPTNIASNLLPPYQKNQLQLFSEIAYQRDLTSRLSFTAGAQLHYYPMNLLNSNELSQRMMWIGLNGGLMFRL